MYCVLLHIPDLNGFDVILREHSLQSRLSVSNSRVIQLAFEDMKIYAF